MKFNLLQERASAQIQIDQHRYFRWRHAKSWKQCLAWFWIDSSQSLQPNWLQMKCDVWKPCSDQRWQDELRLLIWRFIFVNNHLLCYWPTIDFPKRTGVLTLRNAQEWPTQRVRLDLSLKGLVESTYGDIFKASLQRCSWPNSMHNDSDRLLNVSELDWGWRVERPGPRG